MAAGFLLFLYLCFFFYFFFRVVSLGGKGGTRVARVVAAAFLLSLLRFVFVLCRVRFVCRLLRGAAVFCRSVKRAGMNRLRGELGNGLRHLLPCFCFVRLNNH